MKRKFTKLMAALALLVTLAIPMGMWGQAPVGTTLWGETWTGGDANETPSAYGFEGTTVYGGATLTYAQSSTNTKLYEEVLAGGESPELLLSKSNQTWTISNIPTGQATGMALTFKSNKTTFDVTSTTTGITISGSQKSWTIATTSSVTTFNLTIKNTGSSNARIDDIVLSVTTAGGDTPQPTTYTVTFDAGDGTFVGNTDFPNTSNTVAAGTYTLPSATREGYIFDGWTITGDANLYTGSYQVSGDVNFTASYTQNTGGGGTGGDNYSLYTGSLVEGDYLIVYSNAAMNNMVSSNRLQFDDVTINNNIITTNSENIVWHIAQSGDYWTIYNANVSKYAASTGTKNQATLTATLDDKALWSVSGTEETYEFVNKNNSANKINANLRKNGTYGFACYATSTGGALSLYKKETSSTPTCATPTFSPVAGTYYEAQSVTITSATEGATIYYTLDGTDPTTASNVYSEALSISQTTTVKAMAVKADYNNSAVATAIYNIVPPAVATPTFSPAAGIYTETQTVSIVCSTEGATIQYKLTENGEWQTYTTALSISEITTVWAKATKTGMTDSEVATATYVILEHAGTEADPYSVADARAAIDANMGITNVYATGIVSEIVEEYSSQYHNISYNISTDGTTTSDQLECYRGKSYNGANFTSADDIQVGATVVVYGNLTKYNSTYEFAANNQLVSYIAPIITAPTITVTPATVNAPFAGEDGTLTVTYENVTTIVAEVYFCDANGDAATYGNWIQAEINSDNNVYYVIGANDGAARTAYLKVYALDDNAEDVYSNLVTINQEAYVAPTYAALPFAFNGGRADIETTDGLYQEGLGTDYNASTNPNTQLKFDGTGDWLLLQFSERPGTLTFDIKGNGFSGGTFTVQTSEDGTTYTDLQTYTSFGSNVESEEFTDLGENVRYIKWIYTNKSSGNVGLGNITLAEYVEPVLVASITVDPALVEVNAEEHDGTLDLTYENLTITEMGDFDIQYYDAEGEETEEPSWIEVTVAEQDPAVGEGYVVSYFMLENEGEARAAYFKVFAVGGEDFVYSNLVTVTQAAPVVDYAMLPFEFDGGRADVANTNGLTQEGLDSDYASSPRLKFNNTGDWLILKLNSAPAAITFDIQGNSFSDGTFTVQTSNDGTTYTNLGEYTELGATQTVTLINTNDAVRFVKWVYTEKDSGNVGLGNIIVTKAMPIAGNPTLTPSTFTLVENHTYIVNNGTTLTLDGDFSTIFTDPNDLIIEDGGQLVTSNPVVATMQKNITAYSSKATPNDGWYFISSPLDGTTTSLTAIENLIPSTGNYDLYAFDQNEDKEWRNYKAHSTTFTAFNAGEGYLYANSGGQTIAFSGTVRATTAAFTKENLAYTAGNRLAGFNLVGNPFPSNATVSMPYYKMNSTSEGLNAVVNTAGGVIAPMEGVFVCATGTGQSVTFTATTASVTAAASAKGAVNLNVESEGELLDRAIVTINGTGMLGKLNLNETATKLYITQNGKDYAVVNAQAQGEMPVNFKASKDGSYTITVDAENLEMDYLHLIDNMTGTNVDLLATPSYTFEAKTTDYASRFRLVFNPNEENGASTGSETFAFFNGSEWMISNTGNATLQVIDVLGRVLSSETISGTVTVSLKETAGVYMLRLVNGNDVKVQKVVVR